MSDLPGVVMPVISCHAPGSCSLPALPPANSVSVGASASGTATVGASVTQSVCSAGLVSTLTLPSSASKQLGETSVAVLALTPTHVFVSEADALETPSARTKAQAQTVRNRVRIVRGLLGFTTTSVSFQKRGRRGGWRPLLTSKVRRVKKARKGTFLPMAQ